YWHLQERHLYRYYADIAEAVEIPILLYNYPSMTGVNLSPELVRRLALEYPHIVGIKETIDSPAHIRDVIRAVLPERPDFAVFAGADELVLYNLVVGGVGSIASSWNFAFSSGIAIQNAFTAGDMETAKREQKRLSVLSRIYDIDPCLGTIVMEVLYTLNMGPKPYIRPPALPLSNPARAKLRTILAEAGLLKK
ncbi:MAG: dihydrodipicolinate synthase family protein, partial [Armatimonadota bacterium]